MISNNELEKAFKYFRETYPENKDAILLEAQWKNLKKEKNLGLSSFSEESLRMNRIRASLLDLIDDLKTDPDPTPTTGSPATEMPEEASYPDSETGPIKKAASGTTEEEDYLHGARRGYVNNVRISNFFTIAEVAMEAMGDKREIYLMGENGDGKSLVLMGLVLAYEGNFIVSQTNLNETGEILELLKLNPSFKVDCQDDQKVNYGPNSANYLKNFLAYGVHRSRNDSEKSSSVGFLSLFDSNQYLLSPDRWLMRLYTLELERMAQKVSPTGASVSIEVAKQIISDLVDKNVEIRVSSSGVQYVERGTPLAFSQLSDGYKSVITWICDMVARMTDSQPNVQKIQDLQGVVLVDEINLHLHPRWEKQIAKKLRAWFPKVQFIFTTHSPVTVLGASDDAVFFRVYKEHGVTRLSEPYFKTNLKDMMANSVLTSPLFGLEDARMEGEERSKPSLDTSEDYLYSRIHAKISERIEQQKKEGKRYFSKEEIDEMIEQSLNEELA